MRRKDPIMNEGLRKLKKKWDENPTQVLVVGALVIGSVAKLIDAVSAAQGRHAYAEQVKISKIRNGI